MLTIVFCLALTIPAGYALARFPIAGKEGFFVFLLLSLIIPYQALVNPIFFMFAKLQLTKPAGRPGDPAHGDPDAVFDLCDAQQLRSRAA